MDRASPDRLSPRAALAAIAGLSVTCWAGLIGLAILVWSHL